MKNISEDLMKIHLDGDMRGFKHHIYECRKGLRNLVLHTTDINLKDDCEILKKNGLSYLIHSPNHAKLNVFFGDFLYVLYFQQGDL
ncbi:DUF2023 family protein [Methanococcoides sp. SA1]|nr:DUF2023 family protein [Methanococcoides sp. SA1]